MTLTGATIDYRNIKNKKELETVLDSLYGQGFGYLNSYGAHNDKIKQIINKTNKLDIDNNKHNTETNKLYDLSDYDEIEKKAQIIFSKWQPDDKIMEYINIFRIISNEETEIPSSNPYDKEVINWVKFKIKHNLKDSQFTSSARVYYYDLDKKSIKIRFNNNKWEFNRLYKLLYDQECPEFNEKKVGEWFDLKHFQIKFYGNGNAELTGDLDNFKEYQYKYLIKEKYANNLIKYKNKTELFSKK